METSKVTVKQVVAARSAAEYLEALCGGLRKGRVVVERGEEYVVLAVPDQLELEVKAKKKKDKAKFVMELSWSADAMILADPPAIRPESKPAVVPKKDANLPAPQKPEAKKAVAKKPAAKKTVAKKAAVKKQARGGASASK